jgi:hypothetical protein
MSFRVDLWNGLNIIKSHFSSTFNKMNAINNILLSYASYQKSYSKGLESIYNSNKDLIKEDYLLDKNISLLINYIKLEGEYHREHYKFIKHNVSSSLKELYEREKSSASNEFNEGQQNNDTFQKIKNNIINKQKIYNNSYKDFFSFMSSFDENQLNIILESDESCKFHTSANSDTSNVKKNSSSKNVNAELLSYNNIENKINEINEINNNNNCSNNIDKQLIAKKQKLFDKIYESKKEYITSLDEANDFLNIHKDKLEKVLNSLEGKYYSLIRGMHCALSTLVNHKISLLNKDYTLYKPYIDNNLNYINDENEVNEFIIKNATKEFPVSKFEFIPYKLESKNITNQKIFQFLKEKLEIEESHEIGRTKSRKKTDINDFQKKVFKKKNTDDKTQNNILVLENNIKSLKSKKNKYLIEDFIEEVIIDKDDNNKKDGIEISTNFVDDNNTIMNDLNKIKLLLIDEKDEDYLLYLNCLIKIINKFRAKGNFVLIKKSYDILIDIFNFLLNHFPTLDFVLKNIIIFSQTFYYLDNNNKIFLQYGLKNHLILNKSETWHRVINFTLSGHISNKDISIINDKKETNSKLHILALNTLVAYLCDLKYFSEDENLFNKVKNFYVRVYQLDEQIVINEVNSLLSSSLNEKKE